MAINWLGVQGVSSRSYRCGYCGNLVGPSSGWATNNSLDRIYVCSHCNCPTYFDALGTQFPGSPYGDAVGSLPPDVRALYEEARQCTRVNSFTSAVLTCRKLLMHIAVEKGAPEGGSFMSYVEYLSDKNYLPPDGKGWVDYIRKKGNEANHEIKVMLKEDAEDLVTFLGMLLKFVYEFPARVKPPAPVGP